MVTDYKSATAAKKKEFTSRYIKFVGLYILSFQSIGQQIGNNNTYIRETTVLITTKSKAF